MGMRKVWQPTFLVGFTSNRCKYTKSLKDVARKIEKYEKDIFLFTGLACFV